MNGVEERGPRLVGEPGIQEDSENAREKRVLDRHDRRVASVQLLERNRGFGDHPAGPRRHPHDQHFPIKSPRALELADGELRALFKGVC